MNKRARVEAQKLTSGLTVEDLDRYRKELEVLLPAADNDVPRLKRFRKVIESLCDKGYAVFRQNDGGFAIIPVDSKVLEIVRGKKKK